jgi:hypothetical protein
LEYTHYWRRPAIIPGAKWHPLCSDVRRLLKVSPVRLAWEHDEPTRKPEVSSSQIHLNGVRGEGYETFCVSRIGGSKWSPPDDDGRVFEFCKTGYRPYDLVVTACLVATKHRLGDLVTVESDGEDEEWQPAREFCLKTLRYGMAYHILGRALVDVGRSLDAAPTDGAAIQEHPTQRSGEAS